MRDRLKSLILESDILCRRCGDFSASYCAEYIAGYLLANNVAALYCNVGDKVYENYQGRIFEYAVTSIEILSSYKILYKVQSTEPWNRWVRFIGFNKYDIGKTIFLNREDAERALKGGEQT